VNGKLKYEDEVLAALQGGALTTREVADHTGITRGSAQRTLEVLFAFRKVERQVRRMHGHPTKWMRSAS